MNQYSPGFSQMPPIVKNLLIINGLFFLATIAFESTDFSMYEYFSLFYPGSEPFKSWQVITHMFMHGGFTHIFFNMFALLMFGSPLEQIWGSKRFLNFYLITGFGAAALHTFVNYIEVSSLVNQLSLESIDEVKQNGYAALHQGKNYIDPLMAELNRKLHVPTVGASGAVYGLLIGFGMLFPNTELMLIFLPVPIKAKYFIPLLIIGELFLGIGQFRWDNIAHFAHLGGALFGFLLVRYWKKDQFKRF
ncbi:MAG: rhomboid family intramembrane serine protease [Flavobacteriales bacterium]|nr:rhomboid family intramembrane serine protease [Bacteroidales bacterium AH-315-I05]PCJ84453.1 MAG: rhomboid family intramembrane serine protease [Flavobacteriales bacterium]